MAGSTHCSASKLHTPTIQHFIHQRTIKTLTCSQQILIMADKQIKNNIFSTSYGTANKKIVTHLANALHQLSSC
jgi:hypothetical protein